MTTQEAMQELDATLTALFGLPMRPIPTGKIIKHPAIGGYYERGVWVPVVPGANVKARKAS